MHDLFDPFDVEERVPGAPRAHVREDDQVVTAQVLRHEQCVEAIVGDEADADPVEDVGGDVLGLLQELERERRARLRSAELEGVQRDRVGTLAQAQTV